MNLNNSNNIFLPEQVPPLLTRHLRNKQFANLIEERTRNFVGRQFIFDGIDKFIENPAFRSGYILIKGEPGIGKTALVAKLIKERNWIHHFNIRSQGITSTSAFVRNVCAQLIILYRLKYSALPKEADYDSGFLSALLYEAAASEQTHPIVIIVDALDEAEDFAFTQTGINKLRLPSTLPDRVFFVVTSREQTNYRLTVDSKETLYLADDDPQNLADVKLYVKNFLQENAVQMNHAIAGWDVSLNDFVEIITEKSQGNFMYIVYVLRAIIDEKLTRSNFQKLQNLPTGLKNYYQLHWERMKRNDEKMFEDLYKPVVCTLGAAKEPISIMKISSITNLALSDVKRVLDEWREFLNEETNERNENLYRLYHISFRDFLDEEVNLTSYNDLIAKPIDNKIRWQS